MSGPAKSHPLRRVQSLSIEPAAPVLIADSGRAAQLTAADTHFLDSFGLQHKRISFHWQVRALAGGCCTAIQ
jgi:hypothetical protein